MSKQIQSVKLPAYDVVETRKYQTGVQRVGFPGKRDLGTLDLTILETQDLAVYKYFQAWEALMHVNGCCFPRSNYQKSMQVRYYDNAGKQLISFELGACWPAVFPKAEGSFESSKPVVYNVSLNVDSVSYKDNSTPSGVSASKPSTAKDLASGVQGVNAPRIERIYGIDIDIDKAHKSVWY